MKEDLPWIEKYRPSNLDQIIDHQDKIATLRTMVSNSQLMHLLFYGPPGSGKTSMILALARELYGTSFRKYVLEINASSQRGIDTIRTDVVQFITNKSDRVKLVILDESDALTGEAQGALKSVMEKHAKYSRFCLICNDINKISPALQSRCVKMVFSSLRADSIKPRILSIITDENIDMDESSVDILISLEKDFRQLLNLLQGMHYYFKSLEKRITAEDVYNYMGKPTPETVDLMIKTLFESTLHEAIGVLSDMYKSNKINMLDMLGFLLPKILELELSLPHKHFIIATLANIDRNLRIGGQPDIQIAYLCSTFLKVRCS
jgi:replication factor C subunit 3/5